MAGDKDILIDNLLKAMKYDGEDLSVKDRTLLWVAFNSLPYGPQNVLWTRYSTPHKVLLKDIMATAYSYSTVSEWHWTGMNNMRSALYRITGWKYKK